ncbi:hypothetical protein D3C81_2137210 [compost metagenome]
MREKRPIAVEADLALQGIDDDRQVEQFVAFLLRGFLQGVKKTHDADSSETADSVNCAWYCATMASRRGRPLAVSKPLAAVKGCGRRVH